MQNIKILQIFTRIEFIIYLQNNKYKLYIK
jgi:hypothetical protein